MDFDAFSHEKPMNLYELIKYRTPLSASRNYAYFKEHNVDPKDYIHTDRSTILEIKDFLYSKISSLFKPENTQQ
jgi:hypothetical protein